MAAPVLDKLSEINPRMGLEASIFHSHLPPCWKSKSHVRFCCPVRAALVPASRNFASDIQGRRCALARRRATLEGTYTVSSGKAVLSGKRSPRKKQRCVSDPPRNGCCSPAVASTLKADRALGRRTRHPPFVRVRGLSSSHLATNLTEDYRILTYTCTHAASNFAASPLASAFSGSSRSRLATSLRPSSTFPMRR